MKGFTRDKVWTAVLRISQEFTYGQILGQCLHYKGIVDELKYGMLYKGILLEL